MKKSYKSAPECNPPEGDALEKDPVYRKIHVLYGMLEAGKRGFSGLYDHAKAHLDSALDRLTHRKMKDSEYDCLNQLPADRILQAILGQPQPQRSSRGRRRLEGSVI